MRRGRAPRVGGFRARAKAGGGEAARRGERELLLVRALSGKDARGALAARLRLYDAQRPHDRRPASAGGARFHGASRRGESRRTRRAARRGVLNSRLRPEPDMDLATKEESSTDAASELQRQLRGGGFVVTAELTPPVASDPAEFIDRALALRGLATAVNVTDGAGSRAHMSSLAASHFLVRNGIEPILQLTCRPQPDRAAERA